MRKITKEIKIGNLILGGGRKILIQSMCNTKTSNIFETVKQINELAAMGCDYVRVAVLNMEDAKAIKEIKKQISIPLVADIHYDYRLAIESALSGVDKLRINPGNIGKKENVKKVVDICKEKKIPIRIGVNAGSLEKNVIGDTISDKMVNSLINHINILEELNFYDIVISLKSSNVFDSIEAYEKISTLYNYPLHIGITESGTLFSGNIKSSIGIGILLNEGLGDTLRVSLSSSPKEEVKSAKEILSVFNLYDKPKLISCPTCGRTMYNMLEIVDKVEQFLETINGVKIKVAVMGCVVNGIGESSNADVGIAGGNGKVILFKKGKIIKSIKEEDAFDVLKEEILKIVNGEV